MIRNIIGRYNRGIQSLILRILSKVPSHFLRKIFLKTFGAKLHSDCVIYSGFKIRSPRNLLIGEGSSIGYDCELDARCGLIIGKNVNISSNVKIHTLSHDINSKEFKGKGGRIIIEDYVWVSTNAIVLPGCTLEKGSVIAAGAVVTKSTEAFGVYAGVPAKLIAHRKNQDYNYTPSSHFLPFN